MVVTPFSQFQLVLFTHNSPVAPTDAITRDTGRCCSRRPLSALPPLCRVLLVLLLGRSRRRDVGEVCAAGLGAARDDERLLVDDADERGAGHAADNHAAVDEVVGGQALDDLHGGHADDQADSAADMGRGQALQACDVGVGGELDQVAQGEGRHDLHDGGQQAAAAAEPELPEEGLVDGPDEGELLAGVDAALEGGAQLVGQGVDGAVRVDAVDVVELERALVAAGHERRDPLEDERAEEAGAVLGRHRLLLGHGGRAAPSQRIWLAVPRLVLGQHSRGEGAGHAGDGGGAPHAVEVVVSPGDVIVVVGEAVCGPDLIVVGQLLVVLVRRGIVG